MKKVILLSILLGTVGFGLSQNRNNIWEISPGTNIYPITNEINFNQGFADTLGIIRSMDFFITDASICDTSGQLLFYTNGQYIGNRNHDSLFNCSNFNPGYATNVYYSNGLGLFQAAIVLPYPDNTLQYTIFHISFEHFSNQNGNLVYEPVKLYYTVVDMSLDGGLGGVTNQKNVVLINDTLINGHITSCKHGNGRDWWTLIQKYNSNTFYKILLTSNGIQQITTQTIGTSQPELNDYYGQAVFSPDGFKCKPYWNKRHLRFV
jgi:hypothetical protein